MAPRSFPADAFRTTCLALGLGYGYGALAYLLALGAAGGSRAAAGAAWAGVALACALLFGPRRRRAARALAAEALALLVLPAWGYALNDGLDDCSSGCGAQYRLLAAPEIDGLYAGYAATLLAYAVSRLRPERQHPTTEVLLLSSLLAGVALMVPVALQFHVLPALGAALAPAGLPLVAPYAVAALYAAEFARRARRRGEEEARARRGDDGAARARPARAVRAARLAWPLPLGLYSVAHAWWRGHATGAVDVFARTCGATFSQLTPPPAGDCHYLCTVAAQGHPALVRPERVGRRRGRPVVVNRQLAVANAFEDLLHERWPRFGRAARRAYDRCGLPASALIRSRWAADLVYVVMKPAEWTFYLALLLFDRSPPEERIGRMYR